MTPVEQVLSTLDDLVRAGKVRYIGVSNFSGWQLMKSLAAADRLGWPRYVAHQVYYSLIGRDYEWELMPLGLDQGVGAIVWSPLGWGRLTGKIRRGQPLPAGSRLHDTAQLRPAGRRRAPLPRGRRAGRSRRGNRQDAAADRDQLAAQRPTVATVLIGARDEAQLRENLGALGWTLDTEQIARLDAASAVTPAYPYYPYRSQEVFSRLNPPPV